VDDPTIRCPFCGKDTPGSSRYCIRCGRPVGIGRPVRINVAGEDMNLPVLYAMVALLVLAGLFPPWETPPGQAPEFLGFHFILHQPESGPGGVVSRLLLTIELVTIAVGGLYFSWLLRKRSDE
jgi:hypothetical protein